MSVILWFLKPVGRYVGLALIVLSIVGGIYAKGRYDDHVAYTAKIQKEAASAVAKSKAARAVAQNKFDHGRYAPHRGILPWGLRHGSDGFARD